MTEEKRPAEHRFLLTKIQRAKIDAMLGSHDRASRQIAIREFLINIDTKDNKALDTELKKARLRKINCETDLLQRKLSYDDTFETKPSRNASIAISAGHRASYLVCPHTACNDSFPINHVNTYSDMMSHFLKVHRREATWKEQDNIKGALGC